MSANMKMSIDCEIIYKLNEKKIFKYNIEMVKLEDYTSSELKKMISSFNKIVKFSAYSKLKKAELINMIRTHPKVKVEEGVNAVKLSIKTDEDFEKQTKVKKEKVKKEIKKEVEKLDDVVLTEVSSEVKSEPKKRFKIKKRLKKEPEAEEPLTVTKADGTVKELKMKPKKDLKNMGTKGINSERNENYKDEDENLKLYEKGEKIMTLKTYNRLVKRYEDIKVFSKQQDDLEKRLEELKPVKKEKKK